MSLDARHELFVQLAGKPDAKRKFPTEFLDVPSPDSSSRLQTGAGGALSKLTGDSRVLGHQTRRFRPHTRGRVCHMNAVT